MWTAGRPASVTGVTSIGDTRWAVPAPVLVGAVVGLAWAASLRVLMAEFAGPESTFDWFGTFEGVLLPGLVVGALLGWAAHLAGQAPRWLVAAPLVVVLFTPSVLLSVFVDGLGGGAIAVPLFGMAGGYALAGRGPRWARWAAGAVALLPVPAWLVVASSVGGPSTGVGSIFQSPVCSTLPNGVRRMSALDSGILDALWQRVGLDARALGVMAARH